MTAGPDWQAVANAVDAMVTALNGPKLALVNAGWDERNAERAVIAVLENSRNAGATEGGESA